ATLMKVCIFGAGAIGGYLAVELALAGNEVSVVARGAHLQAIRDHGLSLRIEGQEKTARVPASDDPSQLGRQDFVICALKAQQAYQATALFAPLLGPDTAVVTAMNGIPWWYFYKEGGRFEGRGVKSVDPDGRQWNGIGPKRAIGCVIDPACEIVAPGVIQHHQFKRFTLGEPDGSRSERVIKLSETLIAAGFAAPVREAIRWNIWLKLWGNVCFNPIAALTHATLDRITSEPGLRALCITMMRETKAVSEALGVEIPDEMMDRRLAAAGSVTGHKASMLQDLERGKPLEIDALVTVVQEFGRLTGNSTPMIDAILALVQERERNFLSAPEGGEGLSRALPIRAC
ncbi:MAG: 2-dehydropantoate 2-reductase, partial [Acetobacteraceae bacterium]